MADQRRRPSAEALARALFASGILAGLAWIAVRAPSTHDVILERATPGVITHVAALEGVPRLDLNTATRGDLERLPGIGETYAARIIAAREVAPFASADELVSRGVLPSRVYAGLSALVTAR